MFGKLRIVVLALPVPPCIIRLLGIGMTGSVVLALPVPPCIIPPIIQIIAMDSCSCTTCSPMYNPNRTIESRRRKLRIVVLALPVPPCIIRLLGIGMTGSVVLALPVPPCIIPPIIQIIAMDSCSCTTCSPMYNPNRTIESRRRKLFLHYLFPHV